MNFNDILNNLNVRQIAILIGVYYKKLCTVLLWFIPIELFVWNLYWTLSNNQIYWLDWLNFVIILIIIEFVTTEIKNDE